MAETDIKIIQKCPDCGFTFEPKGKMKSTMIAPYSVGNIVWQIECPACKKSITTRKFFQEKEKTKMYRRNKIVCTELDFLQPGYMTHCVTLFKEKMRFEDTGAITEYKYGNGCWRLREEFKKTRDYTIYKHKRNAERTYMWVVKTTIWLDGRIESEINAR